MAVINKEKYLREIASFVQKGALEFENGDRPVVEMDGMKVYISRVGFDFDRGEITYDVSDAAGKILPAAHGERPLAALDVRTLASVSGTVKEYAALRSSRERNLVNVESRLKETARRLSSGPKM